MHISDRPSTTTLTISNHNFNVQALENSNILLKKAIKPLKMKQKNNNEDS